MLKSLITIAGLLLISVDSAADIGFGASFKFNESSKYLPIHANKHFMVEPYFRYSDDESASSPSTFTWKDMAVGVGPIGLLNQAEKTSIYLGARTAYLDQEEEHILSCGPACDPPETKTQTERDRYSIAPTLGFEYFIINRLTIGAEIAWEYRKLSQNRTSERDFGPLEIPEVELESNGTRTNIILRFYF